MAGYTRKGKKGGFVGNLAKIGGQRSKLQLAGDMRPENFQKAASFKKAGKQMHRKA
jgi:hypothetical protein